ncbi:hypothetical protein BKA82DRAFT_4009729 [Pisolithus tinctorius]|nr:hypothetical protein BKA82DRAFT_4009729 [Pisolithus tinctorius]
MCGGAGTNAVHPSIHHIIIWMVLALPKVVMDRTKSKKRKYKPANDADHMPTMDEKDNMRKEMANELEAVKKIILHLKKALQVTDAEKELEKGSWWDCGPLREMGSGGVNMIPSSPAWCLPVFGSLNKTYQNLGMMICATQRGPAVAQSMWTGALVLEQCLLVFVMLYGPVNVQIRGTPLQVVQHALRGNGQMGTLTSTCPYKANGIGPGWTNTIPSGPACSEAGVVSTIDIPESGNDDQCAQNMSWGVPAFGHSLDRGFGKGLMFTSVHQCLLWFPILYGPVMISLSAGEEVPMGQTLFQVVQHGLSRDGQYLYYMKYNQPTSSWER